MRINNLGHELKKEKYLKKVRKTVQEINVQREQTGWRMGTISKVEQVIY